MAVRFLFLILIVLFPFTSQASTVQLSSFTHVGAQNWAAGGASFCWVRVPAFSNNTTLFAYWDHPTLTNLPAYTTDGSVWDPTFKAVLHLSETGGPVGIPASAIVC